MKKIIRFIHILLKRKVTENDLVDLWLIPCYFTTVKEIAPKYNKDNDLDFYRDHKVKQWQHDLWEAVAKYKARHSQTRYFYMNKIGIVKVPWVSRFTMNKRIFDRSWSFVYLNISPSVKQ